MARWIKALLCRVSGKRCGNGPSFAALPGRSDPAPPTHSADFARDGATAVAVTILTLVLGLLTGMIVARTLGPDGRGALSAVLTAPQLLGWLLGMGCGKAVTYALARDPALGGTLLTTWLAMLLPIAVIAVPLTELLLPALLAAQSEETLTIARLYLPIIILSLLSELVLGLMLGDQDFRVFNALRLAQPAGTAVAYALLWQADQLTVATAVLAQAATSLAVFGVAAARVLRRHGLAWPDPALGRRSLSYALRVHGGVVSGVVTQRLDLMILPAFLAASGVGFYAISTNIAWILVSLSGSLATIVMPAATRRGESGRELVMSCLHATLVLGGLLGAGLFLFADLAIGIVYGAAFADSVLPLRILLPGAVLYASSNILLNGLYTENRPFTATFAQMVGMAVTVVGLFVFLRSGGILAAAIVSSVAYTLVFFTVAILYRRATGLPWAAFLPDPAATAAILRAVFQRLRAIRLRRSLLPRPSRQQP